MGQARAGGSSVELASSERDMDVSAVTLAVLWGLSGFSVLTLETVWMRELAMRVGNTAVAFALVTAAFFAFAALGNLMGARCVCGKAHALRFYGYFECASAVSAALLFALHRWLWSQGSLFPEGWAGSVAATVLLTGAPSFLSGAAFPSLAETFVADRGHRLTTGGVFYGLNLLGAGVGVVAGGVVLPLHVGMTGAFGVAAGFQLAGGLLAWRISATRCRTACLAKAVRVSGSWPRWLGWTVLGTSGFLSLGAQTFLSVWVRQVLEGSVYAMCGVLAFYLAGLGFGGLAASAFRRRGYPASELLPVFAGGAAVLLSVVPAAGAWLCARDVLMTADSSLGLLSQAMLRCAVLLPLTFCVGGVFPVTWELVHAQSASEGRVLGAAMALNKAGAALGTAFGLFVLLPRMGLAHGTVLIAWGYWAVAGLSIVQARHMTRWRLTGLIAVAGACVWQTVQQAPVLGVSGDESVVATATGAYGPVTVLENRLSGSRQILLNSRQRLSGTRRALVSQRCQSWVPLLFCPHPERVITLGMAAGISAAAALDFPLRELHSVELVPEVAESARRYFSDWNAGLFSDPRSVVSVGDGRSVLSRSPGRFDAIICDLFYPSEEGTASLYSMDFFEMCRQRLTPEGLCCLWLPCDQHTPETAGIVIRTFADVFPYAVMVRANLDPLQPVVGLLGSDRPLDVSVETLAKRLDSPVGQKLAAQSPFFLSADTALLLFVMDLHSAAPGFGGYPATTDDRPVFAFLGPRQPRGAERLFGFPLLAWLGKRALTPVYPSCDLGQMPPRRLLAATRAGNFVYAAVASGEPMVGDSRSAEVRRRQVDGYLRQAGTLCPEVTIHLDALIRHVWQ